MILLMQAKLESIESKLNYFMDDSSHNMTKKASHTNLLSQKNSQLLEQGKRNNFSKNYNVEGEFKTSSEDYESSLSLPSTDEKYLSYS